MQNQERGVSQETLFFRITPQIKRLKIPGRFEYNSNHAITY